MQPELNHFLSFFIQAALLSICFPGFFCQNSQEYATCIKPFQCGGLRNLSYPFWGGSRPTYCGFPGFMLDCNGDVPLLNISSLSYRVLDINFSTYTLKVARQDLWNSTCPEVLYNTIFDPDIFEIPSDSSDINVILYYNCTNNRRQQSRLPNQFNCDVNGATTMNVFNAGNASSGPGTNITCRNKISVPVNPTAARALANPNSSSISVLRAALANGFSIHWSADNSNCQSCQGSGGTCVYNLDSGWAPPGAFRPGDNRSYPVMPPDLAPVPAPELSSPGSSGQVGIIIGVTLGIVGMIIFTIVIVCYLKRRGSPGSPRQASKPGSPKQANKLSIEKFLLQHGSLAPKRYNYSEIKKITKSFSDKLGQGGYGSVYKGMLPDGSLVAVKVLTETDSNGEEFVNEVASISRTSHVNIVNLLGFCYDRNKRALVYEYMPNRSLDKFISTTGSRNVDCHLDLHQLYKIAVGVAKGLEYLHTGCNTRIVHFDIKPQNILLDEDFCPKISDFGLAKLSKKKQSVLSLLGARGTIGYIAPEIFSRNFGSVSHKSDVYSYGMMVLEMAGANKIVETEAIQSSDNSFAGRLYELVADDATRKLDDFVVGEDEETARKMFLVGFWCIQTNPSDRPSMSQVVEMLDGSLQLIQIPPKPVLFTPTLPDPKFSPSLSVYADIENSAEVVVDG